MKLKYILFALALALILTGCGQVGNDPSETVYLYMWGDYMDETLLEDFEEETGLKVVIDYFNSNEDLYVKLKQGTHSYDLLCPSDYMIERMISEDMLQKLDLSLIPSIHNMQDIVKDLDFDPNNEYSVPYYWGTLGIIYDQSVIEEEITGWADLWNTDYKNQIIMPLNQRDMIAVALKYLGYSMNTDNLQELEEAKQALIEQKHLIYAYLGDEARDMIIAGNAPIGVVYNGDAFLMHDENPDLVYVIPEEGTNLWYDSWVVPKNAGNPKGAMQLIEFLSQGENAAQNADYVYGYSTPFLDAIELLPEEYQESPIAYPDEELLQGSEIYHDSRELNIEYDRIWTEVLSSRE